MHISIAFVTVDSIINFQAAWVCPFTNHGGTCRRFHIILIAVTTLAKRVANILPPFSVHTGTLVSL